jgi:hypothetical protein
MGRENVMGNNSDRAYFLETIKNEALTITQIIERFGCARNTARSWVNHEEVEKVAGSWPNAYTRKESLVSTGTRPKPVQAKPGTKVYEVTTPAWEDVERVFRAVLSGENGHIDFVPEFIAIDSRKDIRALKSKLLTALVVCDHYDDLMKKEDMP